MPNSTPDDILARAQAPAVNGRPVRKDEIELDDRGIYVESWLPERRSRRKPLLFVHGELGGSWVWERYLGYFAGRGWEGHALNLRNHYWSPDGGPGRAVASRSYTEDVAAVWTRLGPGVVVDRPRDGRAARAQGGRAVAGLRPRARSPPRRPASSGAPARPHELREIPELYGRSVIGWETLPERLAARSSATSPWPTSCGSSTCWARSRHESGRARRAGAGGRPVDRRALEDVPRLVIGGGLDRQVPVTSVERLAEWLDAPYRAVRRALALRAGASASRATSRSPSRSGRSSRPTGSESSGSSFAGSVAGYPAAAHGRSRVDRQAAFV